MEHVGESAFSSLKRCFYYNPKTVFEENAFQWCGNDFRLFLPKDADYNNAAKSMPKGIIGHNTDPENGPINFDHLSFNMVPYMADVPIDILLKGSISLSTWRSLDCRDRKGGVYTNGMQSFLCLDKDYFRYKNQEQKQYKVLDGTKYICDYAFHLNNNYLLGREYDSNYCPFEQIDIPSSVIAIGDFSFSGCGHLTTITLPPKLTHIGKNPFAGTEKLNTIESMSPCFVIDSDCLIAKETGTLIHCFRHKKQESEEIDTFTVPSNVTIIGDYSFAYRDDFMPIIGTSYVRRVIIPKTVTHIGKGVFKKNSFIEEVIIEGENVTIDEEAFSMCTSLKRISLPKSLKVLSNNLFEYCKSLTEIILPDGVTEIGNSVFYGCTSLLSITLPSQVRKIGVNPFADSGVKQIINYSTCFEVENGILYPKDKHEIISCVSELKRIEIPTSVKEIGENAFKNCELLEEIIIPSSVEVIDCGAFSSCKALKNVFIEGGGISIIKTNTFSGCPSLQEFRIPDGVTEIEEFAFWGCKSLKTLYSPSTIRRVAYNAFDRKSSVETTWLPFGTEKSELPGKKKTMSLEESGMWMDDFGVIYSLDKKTVIKTTKPLERYSVLEGTTTIKKRAFSFTPWQRSLKEIHLPNSIERIEQGAFAFCDFSEITLPESLKYIGQGIFIDCLNLKQFTIPNQVSVMDGNPFLCGTYEVINNSSYFTLQNEILVSSNHSTIVSCLNTKSIKLIINEGSSIGPYSFSYCKAKEIVIEPPVKVIEEKAFNEACVERIILPDSLIEIKPYAFEMCLNLHEITIPSSTRYIGDCAFWGCLSRVTINSRDIKIGRDAFHSNNLTKIVVPRGCLEYFRSILPDYTNIITEQ